MYFRSQINIQPRGSRPAYIIIGVAALRQYYCRLSTRTYWAGSADDFHHGEFIAVVMGVMVY